MSGNSSYYNDKDFNRALQRYEQARAEGQSVYLDADDFADIAEYYLSRDRLAEADDCVAYALQVHPYHTRLLVLLAKKYIDEGNIREAEEVERSIREKEDYNTKLLHAELLLFNYEFEKADAYLRESFPATENQEYLDDVLDVAALLLDYEQPKRAWDWLLKVAAKDCDRAYFYYLQALCLLQFGRYEDCQAAANRCLDLDPYDGACWGVLADAQFALSDYHKAVDSCDYALAIWEDDMTALRIKAKSLYNLQDYEDALQVVKAARKRQADDVDLLLLEGTCLNALNRSEEALVCLKKAGSLCSPDATAHLIDVHQQLAYAYNQLGYSDEAMACLDRVARLGGDETLMALQRVHHALADGRREDAWAHAMSLLNDRQINTDVKLHLSAVIADYGYGELAMQILKTLQDSPEAERMGLYVYWAYVCQKLGRKDDFLRYLEKAVSVSPGKAREIFQDEFPGVDPAFYVEEARKRMQSGE